MDRCQLVDKIVDHLMGLCPEKRAEEVERIICLCAQADQQIDLREEVKSAVET